MSGDEIYNHPKLSDGGFLHLLTTSREIHFLDRYD